MSKKRGTGGRTVIHDWGAWHRARVFTRERVRAALRAPYLTDTRFVTRAMDGGEVYDAVRRFLEIPRIEYVSLPGMPVFAHPTLLTRIELL